MPEFIIICVIAFIAWKVWGASQKPKPQQIFAAPPVVTELPPVTTYNRLIFQPTPKNYEFLRALVFMARADGSLREPDRTVIIAYLKMVQPEHENVSNDFLHDEVKRITSMSSKEYKHYISSLDSVQDLIVWSKRVAETQKKIHPFAEYLLEELENRNTGRIEAEYEVIDGVRSYSIS